MKTYLGFLIISTQEELTEAKQNEHVKVSVKCNCCNRQVVADIDTAYKILQINELLTTNNLNYGTTF